MNQKYAAWWQACLIAAGGTCALFAEVSLPMSSGWHKMIQAVIVIVMFGLLAYWNWRNTAALAEEELLRDIERQVKARHVSLTHVQKQYLAAQARRVQDEDHAKNTSTFI